MAEKKKFTEEAAGTLIGKAIKDSQLREKLAKSPREVIESEGFEANEHAEKFLKTLGPHLHNTVQSAKKPRDPLGTAEATGEAIA
jgi:hypothetical protein